jgi:ubiquinone/menaquinone biosynthesis C-methylase UbiE
MTVFRIDELIRVCKSKSVLHLGFVQHLNWEDRHANGMWLHSLLDSVTTNLIGIDYLEQEVLKINQRFNQKNVVGNVLALDECPIDQTFDVIVCGELIEHLDNPGLMLNGIKRFMNNETLLVLTTPNAFCEAWVRRAWLGEEGKTFLNDEHVAWYSKQTLTHILERNGFQVEKADYYVANKGSNIHNVSFEKFKNILKTILFLQDKKLGFNHRAMGLFFHAKLKK